MKIIAKIALFVFVSAHAIEISSQYIKLNTDAEIKGILNCDGCNPDRGGRDRDRDRGGRGNRDR